MARMYSRKKGQAKSKKPAEKTKPTWIRYKQKEAELLITKLAKEGNSTSKIGLILRDTYGIPDAQQIINMKITKFLEKKKLTKELPEDLLNMIRKYIAIKEHLEENKQDQVAKRGLRLAFSKIGRLVKYYKKEGKLAKDWTFNEAQAKLYIR